VRRPTRPVLPAATVLTFALGAVGSAPAGAQATVSGMVFDSTTRVMLAGAVVQLLRADDPAAPVAHTARTDSSGRFTMTGVQAGRYLAGFLHPVLDSLEIEIPLRTLDVDPTAGTVRLPLAVPSAGTIAAALCGPNARSDSTGTVFGRLYDAASLRPVADGSVFVRWMEFTIGATGARERRPEVRATTGEQGRFVFCNVPGEGFVGLRGARGGDTTGVVELHLPGRGAARRDLFVGGATSTTLVDSLTRGDGTKVARSRVIRHGTAQIAGTVRNKEGHPIKGARLQIADSGVETVTDDEGRFLVTQAPGGTQSFEVRAIGYFPEERTIDLVGGRSATVHVTLATLRSVLDTVRVAATRVYSTDPHGFEARRRAGGRGYFFDRKDVERLRPLEITELLRRVPSLTLSTGEFDQFVYMRDFYGDGYCQPTVFIDGLRLERLSRRDIDLWVRPEELAAMEVYTRPEQAPPQFTTMEGCGVLVLWTRRLPRPKG
jgi:hypothetical protein